MNIADIEVNGKKIGLYNHETVPFIAVVNSYAPADFKARGGKKIRKQIYSARTRRIITLRKKGTKGRRKIERSRSFRNKR
jgi:hypothetical protein